MEQVMEQVMEQEMEQAIGQVWSKYGASKRASNSERNTEGKKSDNTRYRDLNIINSNIVIWISVKLRQYPGLSVAQHTI